MLRARQQLTASYLGHLLASFGSELFQRLHCPKPVDTYPGRIELWREEVGTRHSLFHFGQELKIRDGGIVSEQPTGFIAHGSRQACVCLELFEKGSGLQQVASRLSGRCPEEHDITQLSVRLSALRRNIE